MPIRTTVLNSKLNDFVSAGPNSKTELLPYEYYSILDIAGAAGGATKIPAELTFFQQQKGAAGVTTEYTNMPAPGKIGVPYRFLAQYISFRLLPGITELLPAIATVKAASPEESLANDMAKIYDRGFVTFTLLDKDYLQIGPLSALPSGEGVRVSGGIATTALEIAMQSVNSGVAALSNMFAIEVPLAGENVFSVKCAFPSGVFAVYNNLRIKCALHGILQRPEM